MPDGRIAFVGEAPKNGAQVYPRSVFRQLLRTAGVDAEQHYVTNVFSRPLPLDEIANLCAPAREAKLWPDYDLPPLAKGAFLRPEHVPALKRLAAELTAAKPVVIVPLGATALWALTGLASISACRGALMPATRVVQGVKLVPTLHPENVMQNWSMFHVVASDIEKAVRESAYPEVRLPRRELWLEPTLDDMRYFKAKYLDGAELLSVDIETGWKQITCIGFAPDRHRSLVVPFWDLRKPSRSYWPSVDDELAALEWVKDVLESPTPKLFQNGPYDIMWLWDRYGIKVRNYRHDTRLIHHALYPELPKSLEFMGACYATQGPWKLMRPGRQEDKRDA